MHHFRTLESTSFVTKVSSSFSSWRWIR